MYAFTLQMAPHQILLVAIMRPPLQGGLGTAVLVHIRVQLLHSHIHKPKSCPDFSWTYLNNASVKTP